MGFRYEVEFLKKTDLENEFMITKKVRRPPSLFIRPSLIGNNLFEEDFLQCLYSM